jgi:type IV fimbrial biogenesis protein FimT
MRQRGFTLVELMVTVTILVLMLLAALPSIGTWLDNTRIRNAADSLQNGLQQARSEAVRRNQSVSFWLVALNNPAELSNDCTLSSASGSWIVSVNSPIGHCADAPSTISSPMLVTGRPAGDGGSRVAINALQSDGTTAGTTVTFNGFGRVANSVAIGKIDVTSTNTGADYRCLRIEITPAGQTRMCDPRVTSASDPRKCLVPNPC